MKTKIDDLMEIAKDIRTLYVDYLTALDAIAKDEELTAIEKHLVANQALSFSSASHKEITDQTAALLEAVEFTDKVIVEGIRTESSFISGLCYQKKVRKSVELLNKDNHSWNTLLKLLAENNLGHIVQKRLTTSQVSDDVLDKMCGLINVNEKVYISISK